MAGGAAYPSGIRGAADLTTQMQATLAPILWWPKNTAVYEKHHGHELDIPIVSSC
jgi:hypothetical protein